MANWAILTIGNTGRPSRSRRRNTFSSGFIAVCAGENIKGHGLGLNLARELARLHGGDLRLVRSGDDWTEFEVRFRLARQTAATPAEFRMKILPNSRLPSHLHRPGSRREDFLDRVDEALTINAVPRQRPRAAERTHSISNSSGSIYLRPD